MTTENFIREDYITQLWTVNESEKVFYTGPLPWAFALTQSQKDEHKLIAELKCEHDDKSQFWSLETRVNVRFESRCSVTEEMVFNSITSSWKCEFDIKNPPFRIGEGNEYELQILIGLRKTDGIQEEGLDFSVPSRYSDAVFVIEGKKVYVNETLLSLHSTVFETMFFENHEQKQEEGIELAYIKHEFFIDLLSFFYPGSPVQINSCNFEELLWMAKIYNIQHVFLKCRHYLMTTKQIKNYRKFEIAEKYSLKDLRGHVVKLLDFDDIRKLRKGKHFDKLSNESSTALIDRMLEIESVH